MLIHWKERSSLSTHFRGFCCFTFDTSSSSSFSVTFLGNCFSTSHSLPLYSHSIIRVDLDFVSRIYVKKSAHRETISFIIVLSAPLLFSFHFESKFRCFSFDSSVVCRDGPNSLTRMCVCVSVHTHYAWASSIYDNGAVPMYLWQHQRNVSDSKTRKKGRCKVIRLEIGF